MLAAIGRYNRNPPAEHRPNAGNVLPVSVGIKRNFPFLLHLSRPNAPKPVVKSGRAAAAVRKLALILLAAASLVGTAGVASAQWYGGGYYSGSPGPYYGEERYNDDRYYQRRGYGYGGAILGYDSYGRQQAYYPVGRGGRCPRGYTVQDGLCKPYRGTEIYLRARPPKLAGAWWALHSRLNVQYG